MLLNEIIRRLRDADTIFDDRIAGAHGIQQVQENQNLQTPSAFVVPVTEAATRPTDFDADIDQETIARTFQILVVLDAVDPRSQAPVDTQETARDALFAPLLNWRPTTSYGPTYYASMISGGTDGGRSLFGYNFVFTEFLNYQCYGDDLAEWDASVGHTKKFRIGLFDGDKCCPDQKNHPILTTNFKPGERCDSSDC